MIPYTSVISYNFLLIFLFVLFIILFLYNSLSVDVFGVLFSVVVLSCYRFFFIYSFLAVQAFSSCGEQGLSFQLGCVGFSLWWLLLLRAVGHAGFSSCSSQALELSSVVVMHGFSCSLA